MTVDVGTIEGLDSIDDPRVREVVAELCSTILDAFPDAEFIVRPNPTYRGAIIKAYTDSDDPDTMQDLTGDRQVDLLVDEGISIYLYPTDRKWRALFSS
jgi:hypothetical protein